MFRLLKKYLSDNVIITISVVIPLMLLMLTVAISPWSGDDNFNKDYKFEALANGRNLLSLILEHNQSWAHDAGRFFPGSIAWTLSLFWFVQDRLTYKLIIGIILIIAVVIFSITVKIASRNNLLSLITFYTLVALLALRVGNDALIGFTGLIPIAVSLTCLSVITAIKGNHWLYSILSGTFLFLALVTYETVILFVPLLMLIVAMRTNKWKKGIPLAVSTSIVVLNVLYLRSQIPQTSLPPAYTFSLDPSSVVTTFGKQFLGALPLSQWLFQAPDRPHIRMALVIICSLIILVTVLPGVLITMKKIRPAMPMKPAFFAFLSGIWIWGSSALITAVTKRWQDELLWGQAYLNVVFEYFGLALSTAALISVILYFVDQKFNPKWREITFASISLAFVTVIVCTLAANLSILPMQ